MNPTLRQLSDADLRDLVAEIFHDETVAAEEQQVMRFLERIERERTSHATGARR
jgi:hypothetical protein